MSEVQEAAAVDLSGYEVQFTRTMLGWTWSATAPDGSEVPSPTGLRLHVERQSAEIAALRAVKRHASPEPPMTGEELRQRVEGT